MLVGSDFICVYVYVLFFVVAVMHFSFGELIGNRWFVNIGDKS